MKKLNVPITLDKDKDGNPITEIVSENIYEIKELSYLGKMLKCKESKKRGISYLEIPCAFDIETTNICEPIRQEDYYDSSVYDYLKNIIIRYNDKIKANIADFEQLRKQYFGKLKLYKNKGLYPDQLWEDLNYFRPDLFPMDIINPSDQLLKIIEVFEDNQPNKHEFRPYAFMYHWQFCFDDEVVFGRTWEEFVKLIHSLERNLNLSLKNRIVVWVHNLGFEWQFMRNFLEYEDGFFLEEKTPAKIITKGGIEFRCSYILSNMGLSKFCENEEGVTHYKLEGEVFDYEKLRTPLYELSEYEKGYCYNDVRGLCECIRSRLKHDTLASIPLTSTGYVRRELRNNVRKNKKNRQYFLNARLDEHLYTLCREAFRGGDTHANSERADQINTNAWGYDIKSSYPAQIMIYDKYPFSAFARMDVPYYLNNNMSDYALIMTVAFKNIRYNKHGKYFCGMPYIPLSKCSQYSANKVIDNGRVLAAEFLVLTCTNIDLDIIMKEYLYDDIGIDEIWASKAAPLSKEIRDTTIEYFRQKTILDGDPNKVYEYQKFKVLQNSIYGCMVMRIDQTNVKWDPVKKLYIDDTPDLAEALAKFYKSRNSFLSYQQGLFIPAAGRLQLRKMLWKVGSDSIYCDTDSIKGIGDHTADFEAENEYRRQLAIKHGAYAEDRNGNIKYLGEWEFECNYDRFCTLGAKKYAYEVEGKVKTTIAGVSKKAGAAFFQKHGLENFKAGAEVTDSGHLVAYYNDDEIHKITIDHCTFTTSSNVALVNGSYTLGVTGEYCDLLLKGIEKMVDML